MILFIDEKGVVYCSECWLSRSWIFCALWGCEKCRLWGGNCFWLGRKVQRSLYEIDWRFQKDYWGRSYGVWFAYFCWWGRSLWSVLFRSRLFTFGKIGKGSGCDLYRSEFALWCRYLSEEAGYWMGWWIWDTSCIFTKKLSNFRWSACCSWC